MAAGEAGIYILASTFQEHFRLRKKQNETMKHFLLLPAFILIFNFSSAQNKLYSSNKSEFSFFSKTPLEDIDAKNTRASSIINFDIT